MNNVLFRRGDQTFIDENVPLNDGQIIFNETDEAIYVDTTINNVVTRKRYGGGNLSRSDIDMALSTVSENPVANKVLTELMLQKADVIDDLGTALAVTENGVPTGCKTIQGLNTKINATQAQVSNSGDAYDPTRPYVVGDLVIYNDVLYRCTTACSAGSWATNQSCFTPDTLTNVANRTNDSLRKKSIIKYFNNEWNVIHSFPVELKPQIGICIVDGDGISGLFCIVQYPDGSIITTKMSGNATIVDSRAEGGFNRITFDQPCGITIIMGQDITT